jgi:hypothetical protein
MRRFVIATVLILAVVAVPATAEAAKRPTVGIGDNHPEAYQNAHLRKLKALKTARLVIPWDWYRSPYQIFRADTWMASVKRAHLRPLVAFNRNWGHKGRRQIPRMKAYRKGFKEFRKRFPHVREFSAWNEPNAVEQPFYRKPGKAAKYFNALRRACRRCTIVAGDVKDGKTMVPYLRTYKKKVKRAKIWALHNYKDATRKRGGTAVFLRTVRGPVWLTETGGLRNRGGVKGQARAVKRIFKLAKSSRRIKRLYFYQWLYDPSSHWDSAFIAKNGKRRPAYYALRSGLKRR